MGEILDARSSVTIVLTEQHRIVVDTGLLGEGDRILQGLSRLPLRPKEVTLVVNTHQHPDHTGNNHLFSGAKILFGADLFEGAVLAPGVWIMETPGHTLDSISVVCQAEKRVVLAGDALPTLGNYLKGVPPRLHVDRELALASLRKIVETAELVVPGHDRPFDVSTGSYVSLG
jgi:glyoxylase-like metal-dependent hydrolase (beta-lactamase superfamily II)